MEPFEAARTLALAREIDPITSFYEQIDEYPKFHRKLESELYPGLSFFFRGHLLQNCERFCINFTLCNNDGDIALNVNARLPQNYIVRNTKLRKKWGFEESASVLPFQLRRGQKFLIQVLVTHSNYMISVNSFHFASFTHRISYELVRAVEMRGDVVDVKLDSYNITEYPNRLPVSLAKPITMLHSSKKVGMGTTRMLTKWMQLHKEIRVPFYGHLPINLFTKGLALHIMGRVRLLPNSFTIDLQRGQDIWPQPEVALRFCPTFLRASNSKLGRAMILRNTYTDGSWLQGETSQLQTTLMPGKVFNLKISCKQDAFEVTLNREYLLNYKFRLDPNIIDMINIRGDLTLWSVEVDSEKYPKMKGYASHWYSLIENKVNPVPELMLQNRCI